MDIRLISYFIGIFIVFFSHIYMLFVGNPSKQLKIHCYINLIATVLIAYYFMNSKLKN